MTDIVERLHRIGVQQEAVTVIKDLRFAALAVNEVNERLREELADVRADAELLRRRIYTLEGMLGEMNVAVPDDRALEPKP